VDPYEHCIIQYGTSFAYPVSSISAHVSKSPGGGSGRTASLDFRFKVAMFGVDQRVINKQSGGLLPNAALFGTEKLEPE